MSAKDPLNIDNPTSIGVVRVELYGDRGKAKSYLHEARKLLGSLKQIHGVNSNQEQGGGGYFSRIIDLEDGTRVNVISNDGQDIIRIESPMGGEEEQVEQQEEIFVSNIPDIWVGVKRNSGGVEVAAETENWKLHLCVWEPSSDEDDGYNIISNRDIIYKDDTIVDAADEDKYPLRPFSEIETTSLEILEDYEDSNGDTWNVVIRSKGGHIPPTGVYYVKVMAKGPDCIRITPIVFDVKMVIGGQETCASYSKKEQTIKEFTDYHYGVLPKGWFDEETQVPTNECEACNYTPDDRGENPHGKHWWQGGFKAYVPPAQEHVPPKDLIRSSITYYDQEVLEPKTGFDLDAEFPGKEDVCSVCEEDRLTMTRFAEFMNTTHTSTTAPGCAVGQESKITYSIYTNYAVYHDLGPSSDVPGTITLTDIYGGRSVDVRLKASADGSDPDYQEHSTAEYTTGYATQCTLGAWTGIEYTSDGLIGADAVVTTREHFNVATNAFVNVLKYVRHDNVNSDHTDYESTSEWNFTGQDEFYQYYTDPGDPNLGKQTVSNRAVACRKSWIMV